MNELIFEVHRKLFHLSGILFPLCYYFITKPIAIFITILLCVIVNSVDILRHSNPSIRAVTDRFLSNIMRPEEKDTRKLSGASWMFLGLAISCIVFSKYIAITAWLILFFSDAAAAIIGKKYGKTKLVGSKTFEGSFAFFITAIVIGLLITNYSPITISFKGLIFASLVSAITELYAKEWNLDDNFILPLVTGATLSLF